MPYKCMYIYLYIYGHIYTLYIIVTVKEPLILLHLVIYNPGQNISDKV